MDRTPNAQMGVACIVQAESARDSGRRHLRRGDSRLGDELVDSPKAMAKMVIALSSASASEPVLVAATNDPVAGGWDTGRVRSKAFQRGTKMRRWSFFVCCFTCAMLVTKGLLAQEM